MRTDFVILRTNDKDQEDMRCTEITQHLKHPQNFSHASHPADFRVGSRKKRGYLYIPAAVDGLHVFKR